MKYTSNEPALLKAIFNWKDTSARFNDFVESGLLNLEMQTQEEARVLHDECWICGCKYWLRRHHIAGRKHDHRTVTVCEDCHRWLTDEQKLWDHRWWKEDQPPHLRHAFFLLGLRCILMLKARKTWNTNYELLAHHLTEEISKRLKED